MSHYLQKAVNSKEETKKRQTKRETERDGSSAVASKACIALVPSSLCSSTPSRGPAPAAPSPPRASPIAGHAAAEGRQLHHLDRLKRRQVQVQRVVDDVPQLRAAG
ncbi:hypothetical protein BHE74_00015897 [Ensete ventricosum]|nr:hypothetical protein GW17_00001857 [Ensete ventricosum]RWW76038.1 hypothetical protein BHE74_00015897 [Ensete ventricosum]RZR85813.1 hypothetical protein BHM03_00012854 [Ensete ventricosum]